MSAIKPRTARVVIYQGDDLTQLAELDKAATDAEVALRKAERAKSAPTPERLMHEADDIADAILAASEAYDTAKTTRDEFAAAAEERGVVIVLHHLPRKEWRRLRNAHPPRENNAEDQAFDCNVDTLPDELFPKSINLDDSTIDGDLDEFLDSLSSNDYYNRLFMTALALNVGGGGADPTLRLASASRQNSDATSS
jgi:hypothetical protein